MPNDTHCFYSSGIFSGLIALYLPASSGTIHLSLRHDLFQFADTTLIFLLPLWLLHFSPPNPPHHMSFLRLSPLPTLVTAKMILSHPHVFNTIWTLMMLKIMSPALTSALNSRPTDPKFFTREIMCTCLHDQLGTQPVPYYMYTTMCKSPMWAWWGV